MEVIAFCVALGILLCAAMFALGVAIGKETKDEGTADTDSDVRVYIPCRDRDRSGNQRTCKWLEEVDNESLAAVLRAIRVASKLDMYEQDYLMEAANRLEGAKTMTVEEQIRMNELSQECERLHKELQTKEKYINYLREDKKTLYTRCDETARDAFKMGEYGRIRITKI